MTILAVTDSEPMLAHLRKSLGADASLLSAHSISSAKAWFGTPGLGLILGAINLPDGDVFDLLGHCAHCWVPLVVLHGPNEDRDVLDHAIEAGALDCIDALSTTPSDFARLRLRAKSSHRALLKARESAQAVREKEEFNFALFQHHPSAMVVVDVNGKVVKSNLAMRKLSEELPELGRPLYPPESRDTPADLSAALAECIQDQKVQSFTERQRGAQYVNITMAPVPSGAVVIMDDVSEHVQSKQDAARRQEQLIHADKMIALGTLVSGVAHEISNPNNVMLLSARALDGIVKDMLPVLDRVQELDGELYIGSQLYEDIKDELPQMTGSVMRAAEKIRTLVGDLKTFARPDSDTMEEAVDLNKVVEASVSLVNSLIKKTTRNFAIRKDPDLPTLRGNAQRLEQVIINLITNSCQALLDPEAAIRIVTRFDKQAGAAVVEVIDEGEGIAPDSLKRILDPFFTTKHDTGGTGLGLSISSKILASHGGTLQFESVWGRGTTARMILPIAYNRAEL